MRSDRLQILLATGCLATLMACTSTDSTSGYFSQRENAYLHAKSGPRLIVPKPLNKKQISDEYIIPQDMNPPTQPASTVPPNLNVSHSKHRLIEQDKSHLYVQGNFETTWKLLDKSLQSAHIPILQKKPGLKTFYILVVDNNDGVITMKTPIYQLHVETVKDVTVVTATDNAGNPLPEATTAPLFHQLAIVMKGKHEFNLFGWHIVI